MKPVVVIIGRPNVGKSTLFNCLTGTRDALVADVPGVTRDRIYGEIVIEDHQYSVVDTGGLSGDKEEMELLTQGQVRQATLEADIFLFVVDARAGFLPDDVTIANELRKLSKPIVVVVNKTDGLDADTALSDFYQFGFEDVIGIAASHKRGIDIIRQSIMKLCPGDTNISDIPDFGIRVAIVGKPNVGKSTLINSILGEERLIVCDFPGTTRDSVYVPIEYRDNQYTLIDTAGVRRRKSVKETVEKFSVVKTLQAIHECNVVVFLIDSHDGIHEQDLKLIGNVLQSGKALVIAMNKWDGMDSEQRQEVKSEISRRLNFVSFAELYFISALHGRGIHDLFVAVDKAYESATKRFSTPKLTSLLYEATKKHQPPLVNGRRIKLRYAHAGGHNPPIVVIHGNQTTKLPGSYKSYLENYFREQLSLVGTPVKFQFKDSNNPFATK